MKTILHPSLGQLHLKKSSRAKKLRITVKPFEGVTVTIPERISFKKAQAFAEAHADWIKKQKAKMKELEAERSYDFNSEFKTKFTNIKIIATAKTQPFLKQQKDDLILGIPEEVDISSKAWQELIKTQIEEQLRREAKAYLLPRTHQIAKEKGIKINKVSTRKAKTRWGSCSGKNNISLSIYLMTLPDELIDYVIYHELAHVKEKNHSAAFWSHLEELLAGAKDLDKRMKEYSTAVV
jgi:predicted metal-dependent hydrolase